MWGFTPASRRSACLWQRLIRTVGVYSHRILSMREISTPVIASLFCACAREAGYGDLSFPSHLPETFGQFARLVQSLNPPKKIAAEGVNPLRTAGLQSSR